MWKRLSILIVVASCSERVNPNVCCVTEEACAALGLDELRPCGPGQACGPSNGCVAAECETSSDCSATEPVCTLGLCEACVANDDCSATITTPYCLDTTCVECTESSQCSGARAICDSEDHACRGCEIDDECATGVCVEATGMCAVESDILFVGGSGATDSGACTRTQPCRTLAYAYSKITGPAPQGVIRIVGSTLPPDSSALIVTRPVIIDGNGTTASKSASVPWIEVQQSGSVVVEGIVVSGNRNAADPTIVCSMGNLTLGPRALIQGVIANDRGTLTLDRARAEASISCTAGTLEIRGSTVISTLPLADRLLMSTNCNLTVQRSMFHHVDSGMLFVQGGLARIENNVFQNSAEGPDLIAIRGATAGTVFQFNTIVSTSGLNSDGMALDCDGTVLVTNNLFAARSGHPLGNQPGCQARYSVFDDVVVQFPTAPIESSTHPYSSLFVDVANHDFHLSGSSPAKGAADPTATITEDLDRSSRPRPAGSRADVGAYESD